MSSSARRARIAGTTDFTATSHGSFISSAPPIPLWEKVYKHDVRHSIMTCVIGTMEETNFG